MESALKALQVIYDNVLVNEWHPDEKKQFQLLINKGIRDWERKKRLQEFVNLARFDIEQYKNESATSYQNYVANNIGHSMNYDHIHYHDHTISVEAWAEYDKQEQGKKEAERRAMQENMLKQLQEQEILGEAKRRLEEKKREDAIQAAMRELMKNM